MPKQYKIKRSRQYGSTGSSFRAGPHPLSILLTVIVLGVLLFVGINAYQPFMDFITSDHSAGDVSIPEPESSSQTPAPSLSESEPEPEPELAADALRAVYLPTATALDAAALQAFLLGLEGTDVSAVMVDIKNADGNVLFNTANEQAIAFGAPAPAVIDLKALAGTLQAKQLSLVVRMSTFRDPLAAGASRANAVRHVSNPEQWLWLDMDSKGWLNPYAEGARTYLTQLAVEAVNAGAKMVVLNDMHFPYGSATNAFFGADIGETTRAQILSTFYAEVSQAIAPMNARAAVYMSASSIGSEQENTTRYGGSPLDVKMDTLIIGALPYQFSGDYSVGGLTVTQPLENPGGATTAILNFIQAAYVQRGEQAPEIIPLIQGGSEEANAAAPYTAAQVTAQLDAVRAANMGEYILYQTGGNYLLQSEVALGHS